MDADRWREMSRLYHQAEARPESDRAAFLREAYASDEALRQEVAALLADPASAQRFLNDPADVVAPQMVTDVGPSGLIGRRIGACQVEALLGAGGMGEVYQARDTKLGRLVAIKILPTIFTSDPDRLARFEREARVLASLNHPHIGAIYGFEEAAGIRALVLELVEGDTLADRIQRGPLRVPEALTIARQIADALDAAHNKGIVHRDLKPANIKITPDGVVKVLDFGLAKAVASNAAVPDPTQPPSVTAAGTREGIIMGTPAYMSPEQACGETVDKRTDIWAFGCVLYEMLVGKGPFAGRTISETMAAIFDKQPDWQALPESLPASVGRLLRRCLDKDPKRRLRDIGDARIELEEALSNPSAADPGRADAPRVTRRTALSALAGAAAGVASTAFVISRYRPDSTPRRRARFAIPLAEADLFNTGFNKRIAISPGGDYLACNVRRAGANALLVRPLRELEFKPVQGVGGGVPFFSPDGRWLGFIEAAGNGLLRKVALSGGAPVNVCSTQVGGFAGATWADDGTIFFVPDTPAGIARVSAEGGEPQEAVKIDFDKGERLHKFPHALPGAKGIVFTTATSDSESFDQANIALFSIGNGKRRILVEGGTCPCYSPSGHLIYARSGNLLAVRFDPNRLEVIGQPFLVLEGVMMSRNTGFANFEVSTSGDLAFIPGVADGGARNLFWVDRSGKAEKLPLPPRSYLHPRISPDIRKLAIEIEGSNHDVYVYDFASGVLSNLTTDGVSHWPVWSPDGRYIGYRSGQMGRFKLWQVAADRSRAAERVPAEGFSQNAESYSPDGRAIAYTVSTPGKPSKIAIVTLASGEKARPLDDTKYAQGSPKFSPDGRWLAYCSNESGNAEVYVQAFPGPGAKIQVSNSGGTDPVWRRTGGELFYRNGDSMMAVPVSVAATFSGGRPQELWKGHYSHGMSSSCGAPGLTSSNYDVSADGQHFLMIKDDDQDSGTAKQIVLVQGWADEVKGLAKA